MPNNEDSKAQLIVVIILALFVLVARMLFEAVLPVFENTQNNDFFGIIGTVIRNYPLALLLVGLDYLLIRFMIKYFPYGQSFVMRTIVEVISLIFLAALAALLMLPSLEHPTVGDFSIGSRFLQYFIAIFVFNTCVVTGIDAISYNRYKDKVALAAEIKLRAQANYRYNLLKGQLNPE